MNSCVQILSAFEESLKTSREENSDEQATVHMLAHLPNPLLPVDTPRDGSCFFHAMAHFIQEDGVTAESLRHAVCDYMSQCTMVSEELDYKI